MEEIKNKNKIDYNKIYSKEKKESLIRTIEMLDECTEFYSKKLDKEEEKTKLLTQQLEDSKAHTKLFYEQLQRAEEKLAKINELSEEDIDI